MFTWIWDREAGDWGEWYTQETGTTGEPLYVLHRLKYLWSLECTWLRAMPTIIGSFGDPGDAKNAAQEHYIGFMTHRLLGGAA